MVVAPSGSSPASLAAGEHACYGQEYSPQQLSATLRFRSFTTRGLWPHWRSREHEWIRPARLHPEVDSWPPFDVSDLLCGWRMHDVAGNATHCSPLNTITKPGEISILAILEGRCGGLPHSGFVMSIMPISSISCFTNPTMPRS